MANNTKNVINSITNTLKINKNLTDDQKKALKKEIQVKSKEMF